MYKIVNPDELSNTKKKTHIVVMHWDKGLLEASGEMGTRNTGFGYMQDRGEMCLRLVEQGFSSFFAIFDDF